MRQATRHLAPLATLLTVCCLAASPWATAAEVTHTVTFAEPIIDGGAVFVDGAHTFAVPGSPLLPVRTVRLALPPGCDPASITVEVAMLDERHLHLKDAVPPAPPQLPTDSRGPGPGAGPAPVRLP